MISRDAIDHIVMLLARHPDWADEGGRNALVWQVFAGTNLDTRPDLDLAGAPLAVARKTVKQLAEWALPPDSRPALARLLELLRAASGIAGQAQIDALLAVWSHAPAPAAASESAPPARPARPRARFWPLPNRQATANDANYDPLRQIESHIMGNDEMAALARALARFEHHVISGEIQAGKTTLRIYLEQLCRWNRVVLPAFFLAPFDLLENPDPGLILYSAACSISNELADHLCQTPELRLDSEAKRAIAKFLRLYPYNDVAAGVDCLFRPAPLSQQTDIDAMYKQSARLQELTGAIQSSTSERQDAGSPITLRKALTSIQDAVEASGFGDTAGVFLLVDNLDDLIKSSRRATRAQRATPEELDAVLLPLFDLADALGRHRIYIKAFLPDTLAKRIALGEEIAQARRQPEAPLLRLCRLRPEHP